MDADFAFFRHRTIWCLHTYLKRSGGAEMVVKNISLNLISLEDSYRKSTEDQSLSLSIAKNGIYEPLIVEGPGHLKDDTF